MNDWNNENTQRKIYYIEDIMQVSEDRNILWQTMFLNWPFELEICTALFSFYPISCDVLLMKTGISIWLVLFIKLNLVAKKCSLELLNSHETQSIDKFKNGRVSLKDLCTVDYTKTKQNFELL